jgi:hypothetical protein
MILIPLRGEETVLSTRSGTPRIHSAFKLLKIKE